MDVGKRHEHDLYEKSSGWAEQHETHLSAPYDRFHIKYAMLNFNFHLIDLLDAGFYWN